jgi:hypothetical protein
MEGRLQLPVNIMWLQQPATEVVPVAHWQQLFLHELHVAVTPNITFGLASLYHIGMMCN